MIRLLLLLEIPHRNLVVWLTVVNPIFDLPFGPRLSVTSIWCAALTQDPSIGYARKTHAGSRMH